MKTIVAISSTGQRGKTSSIVELSKNIPWEEAPEYYDYDGNLIDKPAEGWVLCRGKYRGKMVGLSSEGDTWRFIASVIQYGIPRAVLQSNIWRQR